MCITYQQVCSCIYMCNYLSLPPSYPTHTQRIVQQRVLPALSNEFRNNKMVPFVLPLVLLIAEDCTLQEYCTLILPIITPALHIQDPIQVQDSSGLISLIWMGPSLVPRDEARWTLYVINHSCLCSKQPNCTRAPQTLPFVYNVRVDTRRFLCRSLNFAPLCMGVCITRGPYLLTSHLV